ncbi:MAG TPA: nitrate reductase molybdenum cofactor assembly chaperone [Candidatus Dormibacteraeota bacterium]|nr:nitrate reductase molybdenum cofactor assembly chaperone [Candidatus Dormibacteraeota bacterium]
MRRPPYKLLSVLLVYPDVGVFGAKAELEAAITELPLTAERSALERFWSWFSATPARQVQAEYVETFDLQKRSSLYMTFFTEGDTRKRGQALLRLKRLYRGAGLELESAELPDYLPVMLEFAELAPGDAGRRLLAEHRPALELLRLHLTELKSPYRHLIEGVCAGLPRLAPADMDFVRRLLTQGPPAEQVGLQPFAPPEVMPVDAR